MLSVDTQQIPYSYPSNPGPVSSSPLSSSYPTQNLYVDKRCSSSTPASPPPCPKPSHVQPARTSPHVPLSQGQQPAKKQKPTHDEEEVPEKTVNYEELKMKIAYKKFERECIMGESCYTLICWFYFYLCYVFSFQSAY